MMIVPSFNSMMRIDRSLIEAASAAGASTLQLLWTVILPLSKTGIAIGSIFVIAMVMGDFVTVEVLGGGQVASVGKQIATQLSYLQFPPAAANAMVLTSTRSAQAAVRSPTSTMPALFASAHGSAGADPGPAAYGRGGAEPPVTDANLVLGRLDPENFLGGAMRLEPAAARRAVGGLAERLGLGIEEAAEGILTIVNTNMANAISSRTVQKGLDPRGFALVAFGGAGPLHGAEVARALGIPEVVVPAYPGITSAVGPLTTDLKYDAVRTEFQAGETVDLDRLDTDLAAMQHDLTRQLAADGVASDDVVFGRAGDLRYVGQGYELRVPFPDGELDQAALAQIFARFADLHRAEYGHVFEASPIEIVNIRVTGIGHMPKIAAPRPASGGSLAEALVKTTLCVFRHKGVLQIVAMPFYRRKLLPLEQPIAGPAIVLQTDSTTVVPPGTTLIAELGGNLILTTRQ